MTLFSSLTASSTTKRFGDFLRSNIAVLKSSFFTLLLITREPSSSSLRPRQTRKSKNVLLESRYSRKGSIEKETPKRKEKTEEDTTNSNERAKRKISPRFLQPLRISQGDSWSVGFGDRFRSIPPLRSFSLFLFFLHASDRENLEYVFESRNLRCAS